MEQLPQWGGEIAEPPESMKVNGWKDKDKPGAQHLNWLLKRTYMCLDELQQLTEELQTTKANQSLVNGINNNLTSLQTAVNQHLAQMAADGFGGNTFAALDIDDVLLVNKNCKAYVGGATLNKPSANVGLLTADVLNADNKKLVFVDLVTGIEYRNTKRFGTWLGWQAYSMDTMPTVNNLPLPTGFDSGNIRYFKVANNRVVVMINLTKTTAFEANTPITIGTLPVGYRATIAVPTICTVTDASFVSVNAHITLETFADGRLNLATSGFNSVNNARIVRAQLEFFAEVQ